MEEIVISEQVNKKLDNYIRTSIFFYRQAWTGFDLFSTYDAEVSTVNFKLTLFWAKLMVSQAYH